MKKEISLEERRIIQLEMLKEIHEFCTSHNIRYSLTYGTLIGAIRHKGFIPWDDDVDIMMPLPDMLRFKEEFVSERLKYCDVDTEHHYEYGFSRISYNPTYGQIGLIRSYGVNIDLYIVLSIPDSINERNMFFEQGVKILNKRLFMLRWRNRLARILPISTIPGFDDSVRLYRDHMLSHCPEYGTTNRYFVFEGPLTPQEIELCSYDYDLFAETTTVDFEGLRLNSVANYHDFLTHFYGDYMLLPPENQRHPYHCGHYYWKE